MIVFLTVLAAQHFRLQLAAEHLKVEKFVAKPAVEALAVGVLPGGPRAANVSQQLRRLDRGKILGKVPQKMRSFLAGIWVAGW